MSTSWKKIILHVDMDAFFASVEQLLHPEWKGLPVIVGADPQQGKGRGVVSAASYEARKYGVHSAMPISRAFKLCPHAKFVYPHGHVYQDYSRQIFNIFQKFSPKVEPLSIDEAFLDISGCMFMFKNLEEIGKKLKTELNEKTGLTGSVGIAPTKSVAKIASDFQKPDGLIIIPPDRVQFFLDPLPISKLWGVGEKMHEALNKLGIHTVKNLREYPAQVLEQKFGKMGLHVHRMALGKDDRDISMEEKVKSVSNEITFDQDTSDLNYLRNIAFLLSEKVSGRLRRSGICGKTIHLKIRFQDFKTLTRNHTIGHSTNLTHEIFSVVNNLLNEFDPVNIPVRLIGIGASNLVNEQGKQLNFWDIENQKILKLEKLMDKIQDKFGKHSIGHAQSLEIKKQNRLPE